MGFGNIWRFPYVVQSRGGLSFLLVYLLVLSVVAVPALVLEFGMGQLSRSGAPGAYVATGFRHVYFMALWPVACLFVLTYYPLLVSWSFTYFLACFKRDLPWAANDGADFLEAANRYFDDAFQVNPDIQSGITSFNLPLWGTLTLVQLLVLAGVLVGPRLMGKVMYVTVTMPAVCLIILVCVGASMPGATIGIKSYVADFQWSTFGDLSAYLEAATQVIFSCSVGNGVLQTLGSHNPLKQNFQTDAYVLAASDTLFAFIAGFAVFSVMGFLSYETGIPFENLPLSGSALAFKSYPVGLATFAYPWSNILTACFFFVLVCLGWNTLVSVSEGLVNSTWTSTLNQRYFHLNRRTLSCVLILLVYLLDLVLVTDMGAHWLDCADHYTSKFLLLVGTYLETTLVSWFVNGNLCFDVVGHKVYALAFVSTCGLPALAGLLLASVCGGDMTHGGQWFLLAMALLSFTCMASAPLLAKVDRRDGTELTIGARYRAVYVANVAFLCEQFGLATEREMWLGWFLILKVPSSLFLSFVVWYSFGLRSTWIFEADGVQYAWWIIASILPVTLLVYAAGIFIAFRPDTALLLAPPDTVPGLFTRDHGFGYLDLESPTARTETSERHE